MMSFKSKRKFTRFALAATLGMAMAMGCAGTFAHAADDDDDELLDTKIFIGILYSGSMCPNRAIRRLE